MALFESFVARGVVGGGKTHHEVWIDVVDPEGRNGGSAAPVNIYQHKRREGRTKNINARALSKSLVSCVVIPNNLGASARLTPDAA